MGSQKCDGSILLDGAPGVPGEQASFRNFGLRNFKFFYDLKKTLEATCPGVVSCADLVALTGVYSIKIVGSRFQVPRTVCAGQPSGGLFSERSLWLNILLV